MRGNRPGAAHSAATRSVVRRDAIRNRGAGTARSATLRSERSRAASWDASGRGKGTDYEPLAADRTGLLRRPAVIEHVCRDVCFEAPTDFIQKLLETHTRRVRFGETRSCRMSHG